MELMRVRFADIATLRDAFANPSRFIQRVHKLETALMSEMALGLIGGDREHQLYKAIERFYWHQESELEDLRDMLLAHDEARRIVSAFPDIRFGHKDIIYFGREWDTGDEQVVRARIAWEEFLINSTWTSSEGENLYSFGGQEFRCEKKLLQLKSTDYASYILVFSKERQGNRVVFATLAGEEQTADYELPLPFGRPVTKPTPPEPPQPMVLIPTITQQHFFSLPQIAEADPEQREAIIYDPEKPLVILAGAGSGKTRTLVNRLAYLHLVKGVPLNKITLLTFTNDAAQEMKTRGEKTIRDLYAVLGVSEIPRINARTIDSFYRQIAEEYWSELGFDTEPAFRLDEDDEAENVLAQTVRDNFEGMFTWYLEDQTRIGYLLRDLDNYTRGQASNRPGLAELAEAFLQRQIASHTLLGFQYISLLIDRALERSEELRMRIVEDNPYILVDEFQDIDRLQYSIFKKFMATNRVAFTFVGDDDQSIYGWRGSDNMIIREVSESPQVKTIYLLTNYRNNPNIVKAGNCILRSITDRAKKMEIRADRASGAKLRITEYDPHYQNLAHEIRKLFASGREAGQIAILARDKETKHQIVETLQAAKIPVSTEVRHPIVRSDVYRLLRALLQIWSEVNVIGSCRELMRLLKSPPTRRETEIRAAAQGEAAPGEEDLANLAHLAEARLEHPRDLGELIYLFSLKAAEIYEATVNERHSDATLADFERFCKNLAVPWPVEAPRLLLLLKNFERPTGREQRGGRHLSLGVRVITIHQAKGLEYDVVFITGLSQGNYPNTKIIDRDYDRRVKELEAIKGARQRLERLRTTIDETLYRTMVDECRDPRHTEAERKQLQEFLEDLEENHRDIIDFSAQGVKIFTSIYQKYITSITKQYEAQLARGRKRETMITEKITALDDQITLLAQEENGEDQDGEQVLAAKKAKKDELVQELAVLRENLHKLEKERDEFAARLEKINLYYKRCSEARGLLDAMRKETKLEEIRRSLLQQKAKQENEEKRTFYVAVTRAKDLLYLCREEGTQPSDFITLIDPSLVEQYSMLTAEEERDLLRLKGDLRDQVMAADPDDDQLGTTITKVLGLNEGIRKKVEEKSREFLNKNPWLQNLSPVENKYLKRALSLMFLTDLTGYEFRMEVVHNLQRLAEERLLASAGEGAVVYQTDRPEEFETITAELKEIMARGGTAIPSQNFFREIFWKRYEAPTHLRRFKDLKRSGLVHYAIRSGRFAIPGDVRETWKCKNLMPEEAAELVLAAKELADIRNTLIHQTDEKWPEDPVPRAMRRLEEILGRNILVNYHHPSE